MKALDIRYLAGLVTRAQTGDSNAFAEVYALTYNRTYNYARHYLHDDYLAQDALQEIYITALKNLGKLNDASLFLAWLNRISFHVCVDISEKRTPSSDISSPEIMDILADDRIDKNPEAKAQENDEYTRLKEAIKTLPLMEQQVIVMRFYKDLKIDDIASALNISKSTVKRYLASGEAALKQIMRS